MRPTRRSFPDLLWACGAAGTIFAARLAEIHHFTGAVAYNDQWKIEAADILAPWVDGQLTPAALFAPHFEHVPAWTRLCVWLQTVITGRWDPLLQTTVNSLLYATFAFLVIRWVIDALPRLAALLITLLIVTLGAAPHAWENSAWGFQSQFPFALLFLFLHAHGTFANAPGSRRWWLAQGAGVAGLFTLASMWTAPLAVVLAGWWTGARRGRYEWVPFALAGASLAAVLVIKLGAPRAGALALVANSPLHFLAALLDMLGWPSGRPGALVIVASPLALYALQLRGRSEATSFDLTVLALGLWGAAQAAALAYARGADYSGYASRYGDLLAVLTLASALALARLSSAARSTSPLVFLFTLLWGGVVALGLHDLSLHGHAEYFHSRASANNARRLAAVQTYLASGDRTLLAAPDTRSVLFQDVDLVTSLLDNPRVRSLLPHEVLGTNPADPTGQAVRALQRRCLPLALAAAMLGFIGCVSASAAARREVKTFVLQYDPWSLPLAGAVTVCAGALIFCWPRPLEFSPTARWKFLLDSPASITPLSYRFVKSSSELPVWRLSGAAPTLSAPLRLNFTGTAADGDAFLGEIASTPFPLASPWLVVPHSGYPASQGNQLLLRIEASSATHATDLIYDGGNSDSVGFWLIDCGPYLGRNATLLLRDARSGNEGWLAVAPPLRTESLASAQMIEWRYALERLAPAHTACAALALAGATVCLLELRIRFTRRRADISPVQ